MKYRRNGNENKEQNQKVAMGGCSEWPQSNGFCPNGLVVEEASSITRPLDPGRWAKAEERTAELISRIQPNRPSERHRNAVASYVQRLISSCVPCQVFTFGSVPLKTYLPDGDIDLTAFSEDQNVKDHWAEEVQAMLQKEEKNEHALFSVKEVQLIQAEVRIIKCLVDNIVVDISFNQLGGLCTLCFLEEVDNLISQNHLFKRSIILIKAWCYYESRILGAHHALISTYALETLVLYIFHVFNNSFTGPLEVLYRFLEFFSKFDWANYCVSLWGPVPVSSLPSMTAAPPRKDGGELLLSNLFLEACGRAYSVFSPGSENRETHFISKHLNVIDPLRLNNNLGRSVSKGNFYRIRSAFTLGAQQLAKILECPVEDIIPKVNRFFVNTWDRHGKGCRPDAPTPDFSCRELEVDEHHQSLAYALQHCTFPAFPTVGVTDSHKDLSSKQKDPDESGVHMASGANHYSTERNKLWKKQHDDIKRTCRMNILQTSGHTTHHFARTSSSPELTNMSGEVSSASRHNVATEMVNDDSSSRSGYSRRKIDCGTQDNHGTNCFTDEPSTNENTSLHSIASSSDNSFSTHVSKSVSSSSTPAVSLAPEQRQRIMDEQDFVNKMSYSGIQHHGGHSQMPLNLGSHSFVRFPPSIYNHQNYVSENFSPVNSDWGTVMNYSNGPFSAPFHHQVQPFTVIPEHGKTTEGLNERSVSSEYDPVDEETGSWIDDHSNREIDLGSEGFSTVKSRLSPTSPSASSRTKALSESSWDGKPTKMTNTSRYPLRKNGTSTRNFGATHNNRWEEDGEPVDHSCADINDDPNVHFSTSESVAPSVPTSHLEVTQTSGFGQPQISQNSMSPFGSLLVHPGSHQGVVHNHAVVPVALYHPGPPVPYVTMVPVFNIPAGAATSGAPTGHDNVDTGNPLYHPMTQSGRNTDPPNNQGRLSRNDSYDSTNIPAPGESSDECGSDIFNGDFTSHWKNLQYGRLCQSLQLRPTFPYPNTVLPSQGTSSVVSPGRSNTFARVVPASAGQSGSVTPVGVSRQYAGEISKQRNGTGTYIPNPDIMKERHCPPPRQYRGEYGHDRNENHGGRGSNWNVNSKPRFGSRTQPRSYYEKQNTKIDGSATSISQTDNTWDTSQENYNPLRYLSKCQSLSNSTQYGSDAIDYSVYQVHSVHNNEVSSADEAHHHHLVMMYPYPHPSDYGSWTENLQFGSVRPEHFVGTQVQELNGHPNVGAHRLQYFQGDVRPTSPQYTSSPDF
ncbi:hypothetical protein vseg_011955 [Gypsophila vaccaria]